MNTKEITKREEEEEEEFLLKFLRLIKVQMTVSNCPRFFVLSNFVSQFNNCYAFFVSLLYFFCQQKLLRAAGLFTGSILLMRNFGDLMTI